MPQAPCQPSCNPAGGYAQGDRRVVGEASATGEGSGSLPHGLAVEKEGNGSGGEVEAATHHVTRHPLLAVGRELFVVPPEHLGVTPVPVSGPRSMFARPAAMPLQSSST